jgi:hypothetical protein
VATSRPLIHRAEHVISATTAPAGVAGNAVPWSLWTMLVGLGIALANVRRCRRFRVPRQ